jgi:hypothetical protein
MMVSDSPRQIDLAVLIRPVFDLALAGVAQRFEHA